jgi:hypothetical protein
MQVELTRILRNKIQQHKDNTVKALNSNNATVLFHSALGSHVFGNCSHNILFDESALISNALGLKQVV